MKQLLFTLLVAVCSATWANWEVTGKTNTDTFYHDKSTIRKKGAIVKMWSMVDSIEGEINSNGKRFKSQKIFRAANCNEETVAIISLIQLSDSMGQGNVVFSHTLKEGEWDWTPISPRSADEAEWKIACGRR
jgi:hypothetical protein